MADFIGNSVPLGRANTGAATVLDNDGKALSIVLAGSKNLEAAKARAAKLEAERQGKATKAYTDALKFGQKTGRPFQDVYSEEVAPETIAALRQNVLTIKDPMALATANQSVLAQTEKERIMGEQHQQYIDGYTKTAQADPERDGEYVANHFIASTSKDGKRVRPSAYDAETVANGLNNDPNSYVAPKVAETAFAKILPSSSESSAAGGTPGTFATTDSYKARFFKTEFHNGRYELVKGADGKPLLNLTPENLAFLDNGRMKIVLDGMEAKEKARAETEQGYQPKSRLALLGDLARPFASFDEKQSQAYKTVPQGRAAGAAKPTAVGFDDTPFAGDLETASATYDAAGKPTGGYGSSFAAGVGRSLTLKGAPLPMTLPANQLTYVGGNGKPNNRYQNVNADVKVDMTERMYLLTVNGKVLGKPEKNETSADSKARLEKLIEEHKNDPHARLKLFYKGTTTDKLNTKGDGVVDSREIVGYKTPNGQAIPVALAKTLPQKSRDALTPVYDETNAERQTVYAPASIRGENAIIGHAKANKATYEPQKLNEFERSVVEKAQRNGVTIEDPYRKSTPLPAPKSAAPTPTDPPKGAAKKLVIGGGSKGAAQPAAKGKAAAKPDKRKRLPDGSIDYAAEAENMTPGETL